MHRVCAGIVVTAVLACAGPAAAQTTGPTALDRRVYLGGFGGASAVQNLGGLAGAEVGFRLTDSIDLVGEASWMQDVVTRRRQQLAATVATYLQQTQGATATATIKAPAIFGGGGVRVLFTHSGAMRLYVVGEAGVAHVTFRPAFIVGGADVTTSLAQYGVTLGSDLTGAVSKPAFTVCVGALFPQGSWYIDGRLGLTSIKTPGQTTNVIRASVGLGLRF